MIKILRILVLGILLSSAASAQLTNIARTNVGFGDVLNLSFREADARHEYGTDQFQFAQLWQPVSGPARASLILIHGGCWLNQFDIAYTYGMSTALANWGFEVWSLEYRRTGDAGGGWPGTYEDIIAGINSLAESGAISSENLAILGHSAGGHLALLAGAQSELLDVEPELIVGLAAISDIVAYAEGSSTCETAVPLFMGGDISERGQQYFDANPINHNVHENSVLMLGDTDEIVPLSQATLSGARTIISTNAGHFDWSHPETNAFRRLLELLDEYF